MKILIVDDEKHIAQLIEQTLEDLEDEGVELLTASNGQEALELIERERPQLVYLDIMMPKMNGFDVCETVKKKWKMEDVYVVMLTAKGQEVDRQKGDAVGADLYITKPFDPEALYQRAVEVLGLE
ncbi:MAG: response regulator [Myxococcales bacterium]|nr:response regulator [Myxococcales bacterium]